jgi:hypothetical protein
VKWKKTLATGYTLFRHECPKLKNMVGGEEVSALTDSGYETSTLNEQLYNRMYPWITLCRDAYAALQIIECI